MSIEARVEPKWAAHPGWDTIELAWRRRDNVPLRNLVASILDGDRDDLEPGGTLLGWRRLSQAVFTGHDAPLEAYIESLGASAPDVPAIPDDEPEVREWVVRSSVVIQALFDAVRAEHERRAPEVALVDDDLCWVAAATVAVFVYFETLVFWEHSDDHVPLRGVLTALRHQLRDQLERSDEGSDPVSDVVGAARRVLCTVDRIAASLPRQFEYENGLGCSCPVTIGRAASQASTLLRKAEGELEGGGWLDGGGGLDGGGSRTTGLAAACIDALTDLLRNDVEHTVAYFDLLATGIGPAVLAFDDNLHDRSDDDATRAELERVIERTADFETTQRRRGVFASEARANRVTLEAMHDVVAAGRPSLRVDDGEIVYIYPFGLPLTSGGRDIVDHLLQLHLQGAAKAQAGPFLVAGCPVTIDDTPQTGNWIRIAADSEDAQDSRHLEVRGVRLLFEQDALTVTTGAGVRYEGLGIEVRLGALGNHYVRITISTTTPTGDGPQTGWSPHEIDQFVRLAGEDVGPVSIGFFDRDGGPRSGHEPYTHLTDLVGTVVTDLMIVAEQLERATTLAEGESVPSGDLLRAHEPVLHDDAYEWNRERNREFVRRHAQVLLVVADASAVGPATTSQVLVGDELRDLFGASTLTTPQRSYSTSLDEWARFRTDVVDADRLDDAYRGVRGELISCSGDTTLVFAPTAPNWQVLEDRELVEFAASLTGAFSIQRMWLGRTVDRVALALRPSTDDGPTGEVPPLLVRWWRWLHGRHRSELQVDLAQAQVLDAEVSSQLRGVESLLEHARSAQVSRNQRDREVLERLCASNGVNELHDALRATVTAADAQQALIRGRCSQLEEDRRFQGERLAQSLLLTLGAFAFIDLFWWAGDVWKLGRAIWWAEFAFIVFVAALVLRFVADPWFERRRRQRARAAPPSPPG